MIRYALYCRDCEAEFDAWFASSKAYDDQAERGLVACPECDSVDTGKQIMAPAVASSKRAGAPSPEEAFDAFARQARRHIRETHDYVGGEFAGEARAMYYGEKEERPIWGEATKEEAKALKEEGVGALPLPDALAPKPPKPDEPKH